METLELCDDRGCGGLQLWSVNRLSGLGEIPVGHVAANCSRSKVGCRASRGWPADGGFLVVIYVWQGLGPHDALEASRDPLGSASSCLAVCEDLGWQCHEGGYRFREACTSPSFDCLQDVVNVCVCVCVWVCVWVCVCVSRPPCSERRGLGDSNGNPRFTFCLPMTKVRIARAFIRMECQNV
jgi:hypothetical protein